MLSIVVPASNEGEHIYDNLMTIDKALKAFSSDYEIIAVNDGSRDNTGAEVARAASDNPSIKDFGYDINRGKGGAVAWGAVNSKGDIVGFIDADLDLSPDLIKGYYTEMTAQGADIVIGSKMHKDSKLEYPFARKVFSLCYYIMLKVLFGLKCHDTQTGLRAFSSELLPVMLEIPGERYEYEMNMLMRFAEEGIPMIEEPVQTIYIDNNSGSHFHALRDSARIYWEILKFSGSSLLSFLVDYLLYSVLLMSLGGAAAANILARAISSVVNFTINRKYVFHHEEPVIRSAVKYFALAAGILACNTILLMLLVKAGVNAFLAKIVTEILLFVISYLMQKRVVFRKKQAVKERAVA